MLKKILLFILWSASIYGLLFLLQLWGSIFSAEVFFKISVSFGIIIILEGIAFGILYAIKEEKELEKGGYIG